MDYGRFLVISLGTGSSKVEEKYDAHDAAKWGILSWLTSGGSTPIIDVFTQASADMVDIHNSVVFQALHSEKSYLRIQVLTLMPIFPLMDIISTIKFKSLMFNFFFATTNCRTTR